MAIGEGVPFNPAVAFTLLRAAALRGDPESQADLGFRLALGIYPPPPGVSLNPLDSDHPSKGQCSLVEWASRAACI
jgi:TPR repeat protein